ncbi:MAG: tetratricopeptide repeat protein [Candidatus Obscuribacterales bacterium]|nr:tetratricopeptide repeat protein [Candidatus Obscuribacterales bacterium]
MARVQLSLSIMVAFSVCYLDVAWAQDSDSSSTSKPLPSETPAPNALYGLFQMQPQYPSPGKTQMFPEAVPDHLGSDHAVQGRQPGQSGPVYQQGWNDSSKPVNPSDNQDNPLKGLFQMQPQYPTPGKTQMFPEAVPAHLGDDKSVGGRQPGQSGQLYQPVQSDPASEASGNKDNLLKGLFQMQPQYPKPGTTQMFPEATPAHLGDDSSVPGRQPGERSSVFTQSFPEAEEAAQTPERKEEPLLKSREDSEPGEPGSESAAYAAKAKEESQRAQAEGEKAKDEAEKAVAEEGKAKEEEKEAHADLKKGEEDIKKGEAEGDKEEIEKGQKEIEKGKQEAAQAKVDEEKAKADQAASKVDAEKAKKDAELAKEDEKKAKEKSKEPYHPLREAITLMHLGRNEDALAVLAKVIKTQPNNAQAYYLRGVILVKQRRYGEAAAAYNKVLQLTPSGELSTLARNGLAKIQH